MAFSKPQIGYIQSARRRVQPLQDDCTWRLLLRNCGVHVDEELGYASLRHPSNSQYVFEELMYRLSGFQGSGLNEAHWANKVEAGARRLRHAICEFARDCTNQNLLEAGGLEGFVERMTSNREDLGEPTRDINECDLGQCIAIAQGLIAWMWRRAKTAGIPQPKFGTGKHTSKRAG